MKSDGFVAINNINAEPHYIERMEYLFQTRSGEIDKFPGFRSVRVLRPQDHKDQYLVISEWDSESDFESWTRSPEFNIGHRRAFQDMEEAKQQSRPAPMKSQFKTYQLISK